jgi:hypothetical protein
VRKFDGSTTVEVSDFGRYLRSISVSAVTPSMGCMYPLNPMFVRAFCRSSM